MAKSKSSQPKTAVIVEEKQSEETPAINDTAVENTDDSKSSQPKTAVEMELPLVTSQVTSSSATETVEDKRLVKVLINYPEDYKGKKFFKDGDIKSTSPESAEAFIKAGFATKVEE